MQKISKNGSSVNFTLTTSGNDAWVETSQGAFYLRSRDRAARMMRLLMRWGWR